MRIAKYSENEDMLQINIQLSVSKTEFKKFNLQRIDLDEIVPMAQDFLDSETIIAIVCNYFNVSEFSIKKMRKSGKLLKQGHLVDVRRLCYHFMKTYTRMPLQSMGEVFNQGHSNVLYHLKCVDTWQHTDMELAGHLQKIENEINLKLESNEQA